MKRLICLLLALCCLLPAYCFAQDSISTTSVSTVRYRGRTSVPSASTTGNAVCYFDKTAGKLKCSENGAAFANAAGGSAAGSDTQVQFNDGGTAFGGDSGLTFVKSTDTLTVAAAVVTPLHTGGTGTGSSLTLKSTSGVGATDFIDFLVGNNGATRAARIDTSGNLSIGLGTTTIPTKFVVGDTSSSTPRGLMSWQASDDTLSAHLHMRKTRGTFASPTTVVTGDILGRLVFSGYEGTSYLEMGSIRTVVTGTVASTRIPTQMIFSTATDAAPSVLTTALTLGADQSATFAGAVNGTGAMALTGGAGNMTVTSGTGNSRTLTLRTTTSGGTATAALTLDASQNAAVANSLTVGASLTVTGAMQVGATQYYAFGSTRTILYSPADGQLSLRNAAETNQVQLTVLGATATPRLQFGAADAAVAVPQIISVQSVVAGTADTAGAALTIKGSLSTGSGASGDVIIQTGGTGAGSTAQNTATTALTIKGGTQTIILTGANPLTLSAAGFTTCTALTTSSNILTCTVSDRRVKQDFSPFSHGLDFVRRVQPQTYSFKKDSVYYDNGRTRLGLVAQEVDAAGLHDAVLPIGNGLLQIDYPAVTAAAIQAIKELDAKVARLEARIAELEKRH